MKKKSKFTTVSLPTPLVEAIKQNIEGTGIHSASAYVTFILRQILSGPNEGILDKKVENEIKNRLKRLGYL